jgi:hypothetical protein
MTGGPTSRFAVVMIACIWFIANAFDEGDERTLIWPFVERILL